MASFPLTELVIFLKLLVFLQFCESNNVYLERTSSIIHIPCRIPPNTTITHLAVLGKAPNFQFLDDTDSFHEAFKVLDSGDLLTNKDLTEFSGKSFTVNFENKDVGPILDSLHLKVDKSPSLFVFSQQQYLGIIKENMPPSTLVSIVGNLHTNGGIGHVNYLIVSGGGGRFEVQHNVYSSVDEVKVIARESLDREDKSEYRLVIVGETEDGREASAVVKIMIQDENDWAPKFTKKHYTKSISRDHQIGENVCQVLAVDADIDEVKYSMEDKSDYFEINSKTGEVTLKRKVPAGDYHFQVFAEDTSGKKSFTTLSIHVLPTTLTFQSFHHIAKRQTAPRVVTVEKTYQIFENQTAGTVILNVASEPPPQSGIEMYKIISASVDLFQVDTRGNVFLKGTSQLDFEEPSHRNITLKFNVTTHNSLDYKILIVHLDLKDINDEKPVFINVPRPFLAVVSTNPSVGELVYELMAYDLDTNSNIQYNLESAGEGKFTIENVVASGMHVGKIVTTVSGNGQFESGTEFELVVSAEDTAAPNVQKSNFEIVRVLVGHRPPQFFEDPYVGYITENNQAQYKLQNKDGTTLKIKAKPFETKTADGQIQYENSIQFLLLDTNNQPSSIFSINPDGEIEALQSLDYEKNPHSYTLRLIGKEIATGYNSSTTLNVILEDANDNDPIFELSTYTNVTSEGTPVNTTLFTVIAQDRDSGANAELTYAVTDENFYVVTKRDSKTGKYVGELKIAKRLDYDFQPDRQYKFNVTATDNGNVKRSGQASVVIYVTNINDEPPKFGTTKEDIYASIREDQKPGSYVTTVQAVDPDGDNVKYYFTGEKLLSPDGLFRIEPNSGIISLTNTIPASVPSYLLNITATDDGMCCGGYPLLSSNSFIIVEINDVNNNNPIFPSCNYEPMILENQPIGTSVVDVKAEDPDRGQNGKITYSVVRPVSQETYFSVNPENGTVVTTRVFNRESESGLRGYPVTIKAEDNGESQRLNTLCTFWVKVGDVNDNSPKFDTDHYRRTVMRTLNVNKRVMGVLAIDDDMGEKAEVEYSLVDNPGEFFYIDKDTGVVYLSKSLLDISPYQKQIRLKVKAEDKGLPPLSSTALITIDLTSGDQDPPTWDEDYEGRTYEVEETAQVGFTIASFSATSHVPPPLDGVSFALVNSNGNPSQIVEHFRVDFRDNTMKLKVQSQLDYNVKNLYTLRLRVTNQGFSPLSDEIRITVKVKDTNNQQPQFEGLDPTLSNSYRGSVPENESPGQPVITVKAVDPDHDPPNNVVTYSLVPDKYDAYTKFKIDTKTGLITTNYTFDREKQKVYYINVMARDGKASDLPFHDPPGSPNSATAQVWVTIADKNDNAPYFEKAVYEDEVDEQSPDSSKAIITVTAKDDDDADTLKYSIINGNTNNIFGIKHKTGDIYVARDLDFETPPNVYVLTVSVNDGYHTNSTEVRLTVKDVNDNAPEFTQQEYVITDVVEEQTPPPGGQLLVQVSATDKDTSRQTNFRYSLNTDDADPNNPTFTINPITGEIYLQKKLDRDLPYGHAEYQFNVLVMDEPNSPRPLIGYAYVKVKPKDINDKTPEFNDDLIGYVPENSERGKTVITVRAVDYDLGENGTVYYTLGNNRPADPVTGDSLFIIDSTTGLVSSNTNKLDRESVEQYLLPVIATDRGVNPLSSTATLTIKVLDQNDEKPKFLNKIYRATLSESQKKGPIITVSATDDDIGVNTKLTYSLESDLNIFSITPLPSNAGVINVYQEVDYENPAQRFFNLTVKARDNNPLHADYAYVEITVTDANDEKPVFTKPVKTVPIMENIAPGTLLYTFTAHDNDSYPNNEFSFSIGDHSDRFYVEQDGDQAHVKIQRGLDGQTLDRETSELYNVEVLAIDKGNPPQTGSASLRIRVGDLNDNPPTFAENYRPIVMEDEAPPKHVVTFSAMDPDSLEYGRPFVFSLPPCNENPTCEDGDLMFTLDFDPSGARKNGTGIVTAQRKFFREEKKFYHLPIIMTDMGGKGLSGTSTLTIEIGDKNNNQHTNGSKNIFVYNYKGMFGDIAIGRANANDPDDWDYKDKYYFMEGPPQMENFFSVSKINGSITMKKGVPGGVFKFKVIVQDFRVFTEQNATAHIQVTVQEISEDAVFSSGSIRLTGTSAEKFVELPEDGSSDVSNYDKFKALLAEKLNVDHNSVDVFSVMNNGEYTDIRYAAHGSPWYPPHKLDGIVTMHKSQFEKASGGKIAMVTIDECQKEICESGGCANILIVDESKPSLVNTKTHSFVGIATKIQAECQCEARNFSSALDCYPGYCYNGGTCFKDDWGDLRCECSPQFDGQRCQQTTHSFSNGYTLYPPLAQCEDSVTSIEFATMKESGLIFYNGPVVDVSIHHPVDFISLALIKGYPQLKIDHGTGTLTLFVDGKDKNGITIMPPLNDGSWHHIGIRRRGREVTLTVDHCQTSQFQSASESREDRQSCEASGATQGQNKYLNVNQVLQMGGRFARPNYPPDITDERFDGCIRNFYHNGELIDLYTSRNHPGQNHQNGCPAEETVCRGIYGRKCGDHGKCQMVALGQNDVECICDPGYRTANPSSKKCDRRTTVRDLKSRAYMTWILKSDLFNQMQNRRLDFQLRFRTRDPDGGVLFHLPSNSHEYITLEIVNNHVQVSYNLRDYDNSVVDNHVALSAAPANNGQWHTVAVKRIGKWFQLKMDSGEGRYYNETWGKVGDSHFFNMKRDQIVAGARVSFSPNANFDGRGLMDTCVTDIRIDNRWFPMTLEENANSPAAELEFFPNTQIGCKRDDCDTIICPQGSPISQICYPLWGTHDCRCPNGSEPITDKDCFPVIYCQPNNPCKAGGRCLELDFPATFKCICPPGWYGPTCNQQASEKVEITEAAGITKEVIVIIVVSIIAVLAIAFLVFLLWRVAVRREVHKSILYDDQYDDIRENVVNHDEEGAGEEDQDCYDISRLRKPDTSMDKIHDPMMLSSRPLLGKGFPHDSPAVADFIEDRLRDANCDPTAPPHDNVLEFAYEGGTSDVGSLSSLNTASSDNDQDYDYLGDWGPKFSKLANMYNVAEDL